MIKQSRSGLLAALALLLLGWLATSCSSDPSGAPPTASQASYPKTIHAANGAVTVARRPTGIVSLSPTATEMLYAIGAGAQIKAVDKFSDYPTGTPITTLDGNSPNVEAIGSYRPDLVVVSQETTGLDQQLKSLGIPVLYLPPATDLNQDYQQFVQLGDATNHAAQASAEVATIKAKIATIVHNTPKPASLKTYYYELEQTYYSVTSATFIGQVLGLLGLKSIADSAQGAAASGGYPQLNGEFILKANPSYILLADTICCGQSTGTVAARPGWSTLAAVKNDRVLGLNDDIASRWGPRIVVLLQDVSTEINQHAVSTSP